MSLLEALVGAIEDSKKGGKMVIERIQEADNVIKRQELRQFVIIGEPEKVDKISKLLEQKLGMEIKGEQCVWCGCNLKVWKEMMGEEHAKDGFCNSKEKECYDLIIDLAENYDRGDCGQPDTPDPRKVLNLIARIVQSKP